MKTNTLKALTTALFATAAIATSTTASQAEVLPEFEGYLEAGQDCLPYQYDSYAAAVVDNDAAGLMDFISSQGPSCTMLRATATVLLCDISPADCEPAGRPPIDIIELDRPPFMGEEKPDNDDPNGPDDGRDGPGLSNVDVPDAPSDDNGRTGATGPT